MVNYSIRNGGSNEGVLLLRRSHNAYMSVEVHCFQHDSKSTPALVCWCILVYMCRVYNIDLPLSVFCLLLGLLLRLSNGVSMYCDL